MNKTVHISRCSRYEAEEILPAVEKIFESAGGEALIKDKRSIVIKPNLLMAKKPGSAVTTHPAVVESVIRYLLRFVPADCITIAESPGGPYTPALINWVYEACGIKAVAEKTGVRLNYDCSSKPVASGTAEGRHGRIFDIITPVADADFIIDVCKLKTHGLTMVSAAVKNLFGCIPGLEKPRYHGIYPDISDFCDMLIDLCETIRPGIAVIDGVVGMEGNGPSGGSPRAFGVLIGSASPYAADLAAVEVMGFDPEKVPLTKLAAKRDLCPLSSRELTFTGLTPGDVRISDIAIPDTARSPLTRLARLGKIYQRITNVRPVAGDKCTRCGVCVKVCPKGIISVSGKWKLTAKRECIQCFCCQEMCPVHAIDTKRSILGRIFK